MCVQKWCMVPCVARGKQHALVSERNGVKNACAGYTVYMQVHDIMYTIVHDVQL